MVLLLAAAYTYYTTTQQQQQQQDGDGEEKQESVDPNTAPSNRLQQQLQQSLHTARASGSGLVHHALLRCTAAAPTTTATTTPTVVGDPYNMNDSALQENDNGDVNDGLNVFTNAIRQEWIDAVFGPDFYASASSTTNTASQPQPQYQPPRQGVGLAGIPSYVTFAATIPPNTTSATKLGVTISRLPLGLYVRKVDVASDAYYAGVLADSVLVHINGLPMLVEPSQAALERVWQYEGHFQDEYSTDDHIQAADHAAADGALSQNINGDTSASSNRQAAVREPVALTFIRHGELYTVLLLASPPWGISWAPCGNFALVKRAYSLAADAGVRAGSLVAAVNGKSFREMDHAAAACELRDVFLSNQEINVMLCFTPAAARTGQYERLRGTDGAKAKQPKPRATIKTNDGVEVKFHAWEYAIGGLCSPNTTHRDFAGGIRGSVQELAGRVTAGEVEAPTGMSPRKRMELEASSKAHLTRTPKVYAACPSLSKDELLERWDPIDALTFCLQFHNVSYNEDKFVAQVGKQAGMSKIEILQALTLEPKAADMVAAFLLQFISLICAPDHDTSVKEEPKVDQGEDAVARPKKNANELTAMLLKLSRRDEGFCQRLYFLLRSYISTLESCRTLNGKTDGSRNLMALLNCLELLRFAEKQLADRVISSRLPSTGRASLTDESVASSLVGTSVSSTSPSPVPSPPIANDISPLSTEGKGSGKKKGLLGFLRKKPQKKESKSSSRSRDSSRSSRPLPKRQAQKPRMEARDSDDVSMSLAQSPSVMYDNMSDFLGELDNICSTIERSLQKSFRQKIADWAMQPWSATKDSALANVTAEMRVSLRRTKDEPQRAILVNPVDSSQLLSSIDCSECYILPSAHFPLLLSFNVSEKRSSDSTLGQERLYRTKVELKSIRGSSTAMKDLAFMVHGALAGTIAESGGSISAGSTCQVWDKSNVLSFETRSSWGAPQTLSLRLSSSQQPGGQESAVGVEEWTKARSSEEVGFCWVDLSSLWSRPGTVAASKTCRAKVFSLDTSACFDEQGDLPSDEQTLSGQFEIEVKVTTEEIDFDEPRAGNLSRRRMLLYKHDDDLRQDAFAVQCIKTCDHVLRASGLDMKLLTFQCIPVGTKRGFVEWVPGSVPLSEICQPFAGSILGNNEKRDNSDDDSSTPSTFSKAGLSKFESLRRLGDQRNDALPRLGRAASTASGASTSFANNPVQDYLRSVAYHAESPYLVRKQVMDTYVKSCAGYSVITYILGIGDRHLDNLLLHPSGSFFHCDFSFILGSDPKTYLPMRITEDMILGMGGKGSDNYLRFLSLMGAAFLALRRPESVRILLSMVRLMETSYLPDISENQTTQESILGVRDRLRLDLSGDQAVAFIEELVETSLSSRMWIAVDAIHSIGKKF